MALKRKPQTSSSSGSARRATNNLQLQSFGTGEADAQAALIGYGSLNFDPDPTTNPSAFNIVKSLTWRSHNPRASAAPALDRLESSICADLNMSGLRVPMAFLIRPKLVASDTLERLTDHKAFISNKKNILSLPAVDLLWGAIGEDNVLPMNGSVSCLRFEMEANLIDHPQRRAIVVPRIITKLRNAVQKNLERMDALSALEEEEGMKTVYEDDDMPALVERPSDRRILVKQVQQWEHDLDVLTKWPVAFYNLGANSSVSFMALSACSDKFS